MDQRTYSSNGNYGRCISVDTCIRNRCSSKYIFIIILFKSCLTVGLFVSLISYAALDAVAARHAAVIKTKMSLFITLETRGRRLIPAISMAVESTEANTTIPNLLASLSDENMCN